MGLVWVAVDSRASRDDLAALRALDETGKMDKLSAAAQLALLDSFLEVDNAWIWSRRSRSRGYTPPPPPPPRRRHNPCECDMPMQDAYTNECLSRRFQYLMTDFSALSTDTAYGYTIEGSRVALRDPQIKLEAAFRESHNNATSLYNNMTNSNNGWIPLADQGVKHLLTMEYFWALSVNNAYMNLLSVTNDDFMGSVEGIETLQDSLMVQMSTWFSGLQQNQDNSTTDNLKSVYDSIVATMTDDVAEINSQLYTGWDVLNQAGASMNNSNMSTAALSASLKSALDSIAVSSGNLSSIDLPTTSASMASKISAFLTSNLLAYNNTGSSVVSGFNSAAVGKQSQFQDSSKTSINATSMLQRGYLASQYNAYMASIAALVKQANSTANSTWNTYYSPLVNALTSNISSSQGSVGVLSVRGTMDFNSQRQSTLQSQFTNMTVMEQKYVGNVNANSTRWKSNATGSVNQIITTVGSQMATDLRLANSIALAAPDAVGSETFSNLADMSEQVNAMDAQLGDAANAAAAESKFMGAALADAARQGIQAVSSAGQSVVNQIGSSASGAFGSANNVAGSVVNGTKTVPTDTANSALSAAQANALAAVRAQMDTYVTTTTMGNQSDAENVTAQILANLQQQGISADDAIVGLRAYIAQSGSTNSYAAKFAGQTDSMIGTYLSGAATGVYNTAVSFTSQMQSAIDGFKQSLTGASTGGDVAGIAADDLDKIKAKFDSSFSAPNYTGTNLTVDTDGMNQTVTHQTSYVEDQVNSTVVGAKIVLDSFLASASSSVADATTARLSEVNSLKASSNISIGGISVGQMDQIRAVAANFDTLMRQLNDYIGSQNTPLYNQIVNLPVKGQKFIQQIRAFNAAAYAIQRGDPLGMDDLAKFGINPDPDIADLSLHVSDTASAAENNLTSISAFFNQSSNAYFTDYSVLSESFGKTFESLVASLQADLAAADAAAKSDSPNAIRDAGILSAISTISGQIQSLANKAGAVGSSGSQLVVPYPELIKLMSGSVGVVTNASKSTSSATSVVDELGSVASSVSQKVKSVNESSLSNQVKLHAASLAMQSGLLLSRMSESSAVLNQTQLDAISVINSYANQAASSASLLASKGEAVSEAVVMAQSNLLNAMGRIAEKFSSLDLASDLSNQSDQIQSNLVMLRSTLSELIAAFDSYLANQRMRFTGALNQVNSTNANVLFNVKQKITGLDINLANNKTLIAQDIEDLQTAISWYGNDADLKVPADSLRTELENFYNREMGEIDKEESQISNLSTDNSNTLGTVESSVSSAIESMAAQAVSMIQSYQLPVPSRLEDYASNGIEAVER